MKKTNLEKLKAQHEEKLEIMRMEFEFQKEQMKMNKEMEVFKAKMSLPSEVHVVNLHNLAHDLRGFHSQNELEKEVESICEGYAIKNGYKKFKVNPRISYANDYGRNYYIPNLIKCPVVFYN